MVMAYYSKLQGQLRLGLRSDAFDTLHANPIFSELSRSYLGSRGHYWRWQLRCSRPRRRYGGLAKLRSNRNARCHMSRVY